MPSKSRKAVSTYIAVLLLIALTLSAGTILYSSIMGSLDVPDNPIQINSLSVDAHSCTSEAFTAYLRNVGTEDTVVDEAYVDGHIVSGEGYSLEVNGLGQGDDVISPGKVAKVTVRIPSGFITGRSYDIKFITSDNFHLTLNTRVTGVTDIPITYFEDYVDNDDSNVDSLDDIGALTNFVNVQSPPSGVYGVLQEGLINSTPIDDFVDIQSSDVDNNGSVGTHSDFENMKSVGGLDTLTEEDTGGIIEEEQEYVIHRGTFTTTDYTYTITEGVDYDLIKDNSTRAYVYLTNSRATGMGETSSGGNQNHDTYTWRITNPGNIETGITFERDNRVGTSISVRVSWEIIEYIGDAGGENEIIVRQAELLSGSSSTLSLNGAVIPGSSFSQARSAIFVTSQASDEGGRNEAWAWLNTAEFVPSGSDWVPRMSIGKTGGSITRWVSYVVVEFSGSNWRDPQRIETTATSSNWGVDPFSDAFTDIPLTINMLNTSRAFLEVQFSTTNDNCGMDDAGDLVSIVDGDVDSLQVRNRAQSGTRSKVAWLIESTSDSFVVEHLLEYVDNGGPEERIGYWNLSKTLRATNQTSVFGCVSSDGGGTGFPLGSVDFYIYSISQVRHTTSDTGQEYLHSVDVVQWPLSDNSSPSNYELDLEVQFTSVNTEVDVYSLCIKTGPLGAENININLWNVTDGSWSQLASDLIENDWNNYTVTDYISSNVTIRFKGGAEFSDTVVDSWEVDAVLLHGFNQSYVLNQEMQWVASNSSRDHAQICVYTGSTDVEDVEIDIWNKTYGTWDFLATDLSPYSWNNLTVSDYLVDDLGVTILFKDCNVFGDDVQSVWELDSVLLKTWDD
jgi:FlaG/FlaF family flagellin (archaellin)